MAGVITNVIKTLFTTSGAGEAEGAANRVGRAQTRLGNASTGAGRQFAAQSSGLGGLVGAYAAAAATTFALTAAFDALSKAAIASQTLQGLETLAATVGISGKAILASVQDITKGQLSIVDSAQNINLALSAGFNSSQIEGLASVAIKASRALGRDLNDSMDRVVKGSAKMEAELLDELGIYTKIAPATRAYATALGVSVSSLTEFQRRQAFANAVITEGERKFSSINTTIPTTAEKIQAFGALISNLASQLGMLVADSLGPLVDFLTNNMGAAFATLGIAISMIAGKGLTSLAKEFASINNWFIQAGISAESFTRKLLLISDSAAASSKAIANTTAETMKLNDVESAAFNKLQASANTRSLTRAELSESQKLLAKSIANTKTEIQQQTNLRNVSTASIATANATLASKRAAYDAAKAQLAVDKQQGVSTAALDKSQKAVRTTMGQLGAATKAYNAAQGANAITAEQAGTKVLGLNVDLLKLKDTQEKVIKSSTGFRAGLSGGLSAIGTGLATVASGYTSLFTGLLNGATKLFFLVNIFTLVGSSIASALGKGEEFQGFLTGVGKLVKGIFTDQKATVSKGAFLGITANALTNLEKVDSSLKAIDTFKFKEKSFMGITIDVEKTKEQLVTEVSGLLADASTGFEKSKASAATSGAAIAGSLVGNLVGSLALLIPGVGAIIGPLLARAIGTGLGYAAGSIWDYFNQIPDIPTEVSTSIREKFTNALAGLGPDIQDKLVTVLSTLEMKYGAAAKIDPAARAALKTQQALVLESGKYLDDIESVSNLMTALGQTADQVVKNFSFDDAADRAVSSISAAFTQIGTRKLTFEFIDVTDPAIQKLLYSDTAVSSFASQLGALKDINQIANNYMSGLSGTVVDASTLTADQQKRYVDVYANNTLAALKVVADAAKTSNMSLADFMSGKDGESTLFQTEIALVTNLESNLKTLGMTLDQVVSTTEGFSLQAPLENAISAINEYSQGSARLATIQTNLSKNIDEGAISLEQYTQQLASAKDALATTQAASVGVATKLAKLREARNSVTDAQIAQYTAIVNATAKQLQDQRQINIELSKAEASLKAQASIHEFLQSQISAAQNPLTTEMSLVGVGAKDKLGSQVAYLSQFVTQNQDLVDQYDKLKSRLVPLGLTDAQVQDVLTTPAEKAGELKGKVGQIVSDSKDAIDAIRSLVTKAVEALPQVMDQAMTQMQTTRDNIALALSQSAIEAPVIAFKAQIDLNSINRQISEMNQQQVIDDLNLQVQLVQAKKESKDIKPVEAATQENALQQKILDERKTLIDLEYANFLKAQDDKYNLIYQQATADKAKIDLENTAQQNILKAQRQQIADTIAVYKAVTSDQSAVNQKLVDGIITSANAAGDTWADTFRSGAMAVGSAIQAAMNKAYTPGSVGRVTGGTATTTDLGQITSTLDATFATYSSAVDATLTAMDSAATDKKTAIQATADAAAKQVRAESAAEKINHNNKITNLGTEGKIETENANSRVAAANAAGKAADAIPRLTGRLADLKSAINSSVSSAFMDINKAIINGSEDGKTAIEVVQDAIRSIFTSIQEEVFKQTIANPLSDTISSWLVGGISSIAKTDIQGSSMAGVVGSAVGAIKQEDLTKNVMSDAAVNKGAAVFQKAGDTISSGISGIGKSVNAAAGAGASAIGGAAQSLATATTTSTGAVASANVSGASTLMSSLGPILAVLAAIAVIASLFSGKKHKSFSSAASTVTTTSSPIASDAARSVPANLNVTPTAINAIPKMAIGGLRDRAPTMLEPGEFVIRKPMVNKIGTTALESMNATGKMPNSAPVINIKNEGSPKGATASPPRFDGEKYVIDIVMRDLANNGPIRKSLRGGAI